MNRALLVPAYATMLLASVGCGGDQVSPPDATADAGPADAGTCCNRKTGGTSGDACIAPDGAPNGLAYPCSAPDVCRLSQTIAGYDCCLPNDANDYCP